MAGFRKMQLINSIRSRWNLFMIDNARGRAVLVRKGSAGLGEPSKVSAIFPLPLAYKIFL